MGVLIRQIGNGRYYRSFKKWTDDPSVAFDFVEARRAADWIATVGLAGVIVVRVHSSGNEIAAGARVRLAVRIARSSSAAGSWIEKQVLAPLR